MVLRNFVLTTGGNCSTSFSSSFICFNLKEALALSRIPVRSVKAIKALFLNSISLPEGIELMTALICSREGASRLFFAWAILISFSDGLKYVISLTSSRL